MVGLPACLCVKFGILIKAMMNNKEADVIQKMLLGVDEDQSARLI